MKEEVVRRYRVLLNERLPRGEVSENVERKIRRSLIEQVFLEFVTVTPDRAGDIWDALRGAHIASKASIDLIFSPEQIKAVTSADQSWRKSSGHAAEEVFKELALRALDPAVLKLVLQRDLSDLLRRDELSNPDRDISTIESWIEGSFFDLYFIGAEDHRWKVFGCVQSKTSIRERVGNDREHSLNAMNKFFWSIALAIDAAFLGMPKFQNMINGGVSEFQAPGWHGFYALQTPFVHERAYRLYPSLQPLVAHAKEAWDQFQTNRQWLTSDWQAALGEIQ